MAGPAAHKHKKPGPKHGAVKQRAIDLSGEPRYGEATYYANSFKGRKTVDGTPIGRDTAAAGR